MLPQDIDNTLRENNRQDEDWEVDDDYSEEDEDD